MREPSHFFKQDEGKPKNVRFEREKKDSVAGDSLSELTPSTNSVLRPSKPTCPQWRFVLSFSPRHSGTFPVPDLDDREFRRTRARVLRLFTTLSIISSHPTQKPTLSISWSVASSSTGRTSLPSHDTVSISFRFGKTRVLKVSRVPTERV